MATINNISCSKFTMTDCRHDLIATATEASFTSPSYPSNYPPHLGCIWTINASPGFRVELSFTDFSLEPPVNDHCFDAVGVIAREFSSSTSASKAMTTIRVSYQMELIKLSMLN